MQEYIDTSNAANTHTGKVVAFSKLLDSIFGVSSYEIVSNVEQYIKHGGIVKLKGRLDLRLGQTIIEFKIDLSKELETAKEEIKRYTHILTKNNEKIAACIITDGITFKVYSTPEFKEIRTLKFNEITPDQAILFLDTFLFIGRKTPTAYDLNLRFGPGAPIYEKIVSQLSELFKQHKNSVKFNLWSKNMQLVYGTTPPEESFISQSYLMMLIRLLLARKLIKNEFKNTLELLNGNFFNSQGINIIEEDFFSWIIEPLYWNQFKPLTDIIIEALDSYDLDNIDEDIFKEIYQEIVKRGERHRIGEYYTPEWLANLVFEDTMKIIDPDNDKKIISILDPACGSGTFLTNAITYFKNKNCKLEDIIENIYGMDLNPLAVEIARANYLLALGNLIEKRKDEIFIPVYMADSIKLPKVRKEFTYGISILTIDVGKGIEINIPLEIAVDNKKLKKVLRIYNEIIIQYKKKKIQRKNISEILLKSKCCKKENMGIITKTLNTILNLVDDKKDSIWVFMLRNIYAPLRMTQIKFDLIIGNPPWIALRYIENSDYQAFLKSKVFEYDLLSKKETALFTQMDTSTVFYAESSDIYLKKDGILSFVMPRSVITGAKQHSNFKKQQKPKMKILKIIDTEKVNPLFNVDSCSIISKKGLNTKYPVPYKVISGTLPERNMRLVKALKYLTIQNKDYQPSNIEGKLSPYHDLLLNGAGIYPRSLWFIDFIPGDFGINPSKPKVKSNILPDSKEPWNKVFLEGEIEKEFIYATVTGKCILPFKSEYLPITLPIKKGDRTWKILSTSDLRKDGKFKIAEWVDEAQKAWKNNATKKNYQNYPDPMDYVNFNNKLLNQKINHKYFVVYTASGTHIAAVVIDTNKLPDFQIKSTKITPNGFVPDVTTFTFSTNDKDEAFYLVAVLNSNILNEKIKINQPRGKFGPRHIHRRPFEFNIPIFDANNSLHEKISKLGLKCTKEASLLSKMSRLKIKNSIKTLPQIDELVKELLK